MRTFWRDAEYIQGGNASKASIPMISHSISRHIRVLSSIAFIPFLFCSGTANADVIHVEPGGLSLTEAVASASSGDVIQLSAGTHVPGGQSLIAGKDLVIRGEVDEATGEPISIIDGEHLHSLFVVSVDSAGHFENLHLTRSRTAIRFDLGSGSLLNCVLTDNHSEDFGGAILLRSSHVSIRDCRFEGNSALVSGGAVGLVSQDLERNIIENSTFIENTAFVGGAIYALCAPVSIDFCRFEGNASDGMAGAVYLRDGGELDLHVRECEFSANHSGEGGALVFQRFPWQSLEIRNSKFCANEGGHIHEIEPENATFPDYVMNGTNVFGHSCRNRLDLNNDGVIDGQDLGLFFGLFHTFDPNADFDGDFFVASGDLGLLLGGWGKVK